jgi:hypothetical protein
MKKLLLVLTVVVMTSFLLVGCLPTTNNPPVITTVALPNAVVGTAYTTTVGATDADGDALTFSLLSGPTDMVISEAGAISGWTPAAVGTEDVTVAVTDGTDAVTADYTITVEVAPIVNTAPVITAIADQETTLGETFTYAVVATDAEGGTLSYSLATSPLLMEIEATTGVITWNPEFATQLGPHSVAVEVSDGELVATEDFVLTVVELEGLVIDIDVPDAYLHLTKGLIVAAGCHEVVATFSDSIAEDMDVWARWADVNAGDEVNGPWVLLEGNTDGTVFTGEICFDGEFLDCADICIEIKIGAICCDPILYSEMITVDTTPPCASFIVDIEDCDEDPCFPALGASMTFTTTCEDICDVPFGCCGDECSGVGEWSFVLDASECADPCDTEDGYDCPIIGAFECGCLLYEGEEVSTGVLSTGVHVIDVIIEDNVGNEFTDTWTLTFDSDSLVTFDAPGATVTINADGTYSVDYGCTWDGCEECFPIVG